MARRPVSLSRGGHSTTKGPPSMSGFLSPRRDYRPDDPFADPLDAVLAELAVNIQLPPGLHAKAIERYEAVRHYIERPGSPLEGRVACFYPQGSMAIDATTSTRG